MARGGKRKGAGRPAPSGIPRRRLTVALREDLLSEITQQAEGLKISFNNHLNDLLAAQLKSFVLAPDQIDAVGQIEKSSKYQTLPLPFEENQGVDLAVYDQLLKQVDALDRELAVLPPDEDEAESPPTYQELEQQLWCWSSQSVNRHAKEIQYWRKHYRQDKAFWEAMDRLASRTHTRFRELLMDNRLPITFHEEALALAELPAKTLKIVASRMLKGEKDLKQALKGHEEKFRQMATRHMRKANPLSSAYVFVSELES